uniref:N-acetylneuraminate-9-phosphate synthase n=1 Tax=Timema shepardi TaxID=629360 RepID=A0A7R9AM32_TIMSH|nr:unnamed protein product [Timema shepardi]
MADDLNIGPERKIGMSHPCFIVAEIGQNHQGDINIAKQLISAAKASGADCVKFQKSCLVEKFNSAALERPYLGPNSWGDTYKEHKQFLEFSLDQFRELQEFATRQEGVMFSASAMDMVSIDELDSMNVPFIKIGSGDANNLPLLKYATSKKRPLIISTGMQDMSTVRAVYRTVKAAGGQFCLCHCVSAYPTPPQQVNLRVLDTYRWEFPDIHVGYSGHELGTAISVAAVALGARVLERHITLDKSWKGSDHICSLTPEEFKELVNQVRTVELAMGSPVKSFQPNERPCYNKLGKSVVATRPLPHGHVIRDSDIIAKVIKDLD